MWHFGGHLWRQFLVDVLSENLWGNFGEHFLKGDFL